VSDSELISFRGPEEGFWCRRAFTLGFFLLTPIFHIIVSDRMFMGFKPIERYEARLNVECGRVGKEGLAHVYPILTFLFILVKIHF
jgi:hypothetical protein